MTPAQTIAPTTEQLAAISPSWRAAEAAAAQSVERFAGTPAAGLSVAECLLLARIHSQNLFDGKGELNFRGQTDLSDHGASLCGKGLCESLITDGVCYWLTEAGIPVAEWAYEAVGGASNPYTRAHPVHRCYEGGL